MSGPAGGTLPDDLIEYYKHKQGYKQAELQAVRNHQKVKNWTKVGLRGAGEAGLWGGVWTMPSCKHWALLLLLKAGLHAGALPAVHK